MRKFIYIFCLLGTTPAFAAGLCMSSWDLDVHQSAFQGDYKFSDQYGRFRIGYKPNYKTSKPIMLGESWCTTAVQPGGDGWDTYGNNCFCRYTHIAPTDGYLAPFNGEWVLRIRWYSVSCASSCPGYCSDYTRGGQERLRAMIIPSK